MSDGTGFILFLLLAVGGTIVFGIFAVWLVLWLTKRARERRQRYYQQHEMRPGPQLNLSNAWLSSRPSTDFFFSTSGAPGLGALSEEQVLNRDGRELVAFAESFRHDDSTTTYWDVSVTTRWRGELFAGRKRADGDAPPPLTAEARGWCERRELANVIAYQGLIVVRGFRVEDLEANAGRAVWLAEQLEAAIASQMR